MIYDNIVSTSSNNSLTIVLLFVTMAASQPRGLHNFILDIRNAPSKEDERIRVDKELANIRGKFSSSSTLNSYQKKK